MYNIINDKIEEIINIFDNNKTIKEMLSLKEKILADEDIVLKLKKYEKLLINPYDEECIQIKRDLLNNKDFSTYKNYEDELYILILKINKKLGNLIKEKSCYK